MDGFIVPDLPPEEAADFEAALPPALPLVRRLAPTAPPERARRVLAGARGFIYMVSVTGTTGVRAELPPDLAGFIARTRAAFAPGAAVPLCVGFGISTPEDAARAAEFADGIIVGSALLKIVENGGTPKDVEHFVAGLRKAIDA